MKVYRISTLATPKNSRYKEYASLVMVNESDWGYIAPDGEAFNGIPFGRKWLNPRLYIEEPLLPRPNFYGWFGEIVCDEKARTLAGEALEMSGELLPVQIEGVKGKFWAYNATNTINVVDRKKSQSERLGPGPDGKIMKKPAFFADRFGEESLFKITEDRGTFLYCVEISGEPTDGEFKAVVERHQLTGLVFELIWTDEKTERPPRARKTKS